MAERDKQSGGRGLEPMPRAGGAMPLSEDNYLIRVMDSLAEMPQAPWNQLLAQQAHATPFMRHEYLLALELSGSATPPHRLVTSGDQRMARLNAAGSLCGLPQDPLVWRICLRLGMGQITDCP